MEEECMDKVIWCLYIDIGWTRAIGRNFILYLCLQDFLRNFIYLFDCAGSYLSHMGSLSLFFFFWLCWVFTPSCGFSLLLRCSASHCGGFSWCGAPALECTGSVVVVHGLSRPTARGTLLEQGWNLCPLHWRTESLPLSHQGSPCLQDF